MMKDTPAYKNLHRDFRLQWLKQFLLRYFEESDGRVFDRTLKRHENQASMYIMEFFESPVVNIFDWQKLILIFYKTEYEKFFYKWVYVTKKISRPIIRPPSPSAESPPPTPSKKSKNKPTTKGKKGKERKGNGKDDLKSSDDQHSETDNPATDEEKSKRRKSGESKARPESPQTAMEMGPQAESELITQKVKTLVKKKKRVSQLHCHVGPVSKKLQNSKFKVLYICRKSINEIPGFDTYAEAVAELPKYIFVGTLNIREYTTCFRKQLKVLINHLDSSLTEPEFANDVFLHTFGAKSKRLYKFKNLALPYDAFFVSASNFYHNYQRISRKLYSECGTPKDININVLKTRLSKKEPIPKRYTLKTIISSPLYLLREELANIFYNIRQIKQLKEIGEIDGQHGQPPAAPMKSNLVNHLYGLIKKINWCLNHIESDIDIELSPWPGIDEIIALPADELQTKKEVLTKMEKKLEIWGKYVKTLLNRCRSKDPKGCGPVAEYQYWFKREDQLGPLVLTLYGRNVTNILNVLKKVDSPEVKLFVEKRLCLKRYYEISRDNRDYISACIQCLEGINTAKYMDEVRRIIPEFWENLRYLWLLSGYWAVKSNIVGFIERVQYLIVKKSIRVLEVNHFFMVPQIIAKQLAVDVIHTMETWKNSFHQVKAYIETHQWEMRWEFPLHRIFTITDYMAKLAKDFSYLAESLKQYLDIFCYAFSQIVQDEFVIEAFSERVKSLTVPLKSADFNIYDPDNDVHWNLLIESFARDLNTIEKESLQIINQSFKNLRSSVYATNFLIMLKELKSEDKSYKLLMKKFEFVNIQVIKEIKLINEFIMNQILSPPILNYHTSYPGKIYWIRQLCTSVQFRYWYLSSIDEIKNTRTQYRAEECFIRFTKFYELYQLTAFIDWIYTRNQNIHSQLSGKIFKLKNVPSPFENESYENLWYKPRLAKIYKIKIKPFQLQVEGHDNELNEKSSGKFKHGNNKTNKSTKTDDKELTKVSQITSLNQNGELSAGERVISAPSRQVKEDYQHIEQNILEQRRLLLFLLYHEKRTLQHSRRRKLLLSKTFREGQNKAGHSRDISSQEMECTETREDRSETLEDEGKDKIGIPCEFPQQNEANEELVRKESDFEPQMETRTSFSGLKNIQEIFSSQISSEFLFTGRHDVIVESIIKVADEILKSYSDVPSHFLDIKCGDPLAFLFLLPLFFSDTIRMSSVQPYSESSECTLSYSTDSELADHYGIKDYPALNKDTLFEISAYNVKRITESRFINHKALENVSPYAFLQENSQIRPSNSLYELINHKSSHFLANECNISNQQSMGNTANCTERNEDASDVEIKSDVPWHEYISDYLLIERGHLVSLNFDVKLFDVILEIYHMTKLGYKLPSQFYGLCLLNRTLLRDLQALRKITDQYNNLILKLTKESLLTLKVYIYEFEYLLLKGLNYYSWHTTKVDHFCIQLHTKMKKIICLENDTENITRYIDQNIAKIKGINWFNFSQISSIKCLNIKEFFEELEEVRNTAFRELSAIFNSISRLLKKLEYLVLNQYSGRSQYLVLYYKNYEEEIFKALVSNFLLNTRRFKNFIIGKSTQKIHLKLINNPNVEYDFNDEQCRYFLLKSLEKLLFRYKSIPRWKMGTCENVPSVKSNGLDKIYRHNYLEDMMKLKIVATELIDTRQIIDAVTHSVSSYLTRWEHYKILWDFDKEITTDNFMKLKQDVIGRSDVIFGYYDNFISELNSCKDSVEIYCIRVDLKNTVQEILRHALEWKNILKCKLTEQARKHSSKLHHRLSVIYDILTNRVKNLEDFQNVLQSIKDFVELSSDYEILVSFISEIQYILARHGLRYSEDDRKTQKEIQHMYSVILKLSKYRAFQIKPSFKIYSNISEERIDAFTKECNSFAEHYYKVGPGTVGDKLDDGYILLEEFRMGFNGLNLKRESMIQAEQLFDHTPHSYKIFDEAFDEFCNLEIAYKLYQKQKDAQIEWAKIPWIYLNAAELSSGIDQLLLEFENLTVAVKSLPVAHEVWICMNNFKESIPLMVELKNESLKERHWKELMLKTGHEFEMIASKFTLNDMFCMKLHQHKGTVNDIIGKAVKELGVEKSINFVNKFWNSQRLTCISRNKQIILDDTYGTLILLDDYCINLQSMADSQFALPFVPEIKEWEQKLSNIREIITEITTLQGSLINLKTIFDDRRLQKTLPEAHKLFEFIDKEFTKLMKSIQFKKNILQQTLVPGQLESIKVLIQNVDDCKHFLSNYIASKRSQFPRFFLLEDEEVFSIMGSKGPEKIQVFISKIFCNLKEMLLNERKSKKDTIEVKGMISCEDENLNFKNPVLLLETLPSWMSSVQEEMKCSTKYMTKMAIYSYAAANQTRTEWIYEHISSCILAAIKVWWTLEVEDTLRKMKKGEMQAMKLYINVLNTHLHETFSEVNKSLKRVDRMKFRNVILTDLHGRDVAEKLSNNSIISTNDFEWESQIRFYWKKQEDSLYISQCLEEFEYGYEYMGIGRRLVITPLTERIYLALTQALSMKFGGALTGPVSTGKTETVKDLAKIFGIFCIFTNCSDTMTLESFKKIIAGLCQDGMWGCFDEFNLISESILTVIWKYMEAIRTSMVNNHISVNLDGSKIPLNRRIGLFITMNPGFVRREKLPHTIRLLFRSVACISPHTEQICEAVLFSEGFLHAKILAKKMVKLYELAKTQLSNKRHYDFGLRSIKSLLMIVGDLKRNAPDMEEDVVLMRALRDLNRSKFVPGDDVIFKDLISDLFPGVDCPPKLHPELEKAILEALTGKDYIYIEKQGAKVVELYEVLNLRQSALIVGPSGGGKTLIINTLCHVLTCLGTPTSVIKINPKAVPPSHLFGYFDNVTQNWIDGIFSKLFRNINNVVEPQTRRYILCDGDIDPLWTENINSVMDDNKQLTLANSERIPLAENCGLLFETGHVQNVSPGIISRTGVVYVNPKENGYRPYWDKWVKTRIDEDEVILLNNYFEKYVPDTLQLIFGEHNETGFRPPLSTVIPLTKLNMVVQLCFMIDTLLPIVEKDVPQQLQTTKYICQKDRSEEGAGAKDSTSTSIKPSESHSTDQLMIQDEPNYPVECIFIQALYTSLGAALSQDSQIVFDEFIKKKTGFNQFDDADEKKATFGFLPTKLDTLFDYCADLNKGFWIPWSDLVEPYVHDRTKHFDEVIVPTKDSSRLVWIISMINKLNSEEFNYKSVSL